MRYWIGVPYLCFVGYTGGSIIVEAIVIGLLFSMIDVITGEQI